MSQEKSSIPLHHHFQDGIFRGKGSAEPCARCILEQAAPEMYEALKAAMVVISQHYEGNCCTEKINQIQTAILKAEGRE